VLSTSITRGEGLSGAEAASRLRRDGPNSLPAAKRRHPLVLLAKQLVHFFAVMLWIEELRADVLEHVFHRVLLVDPAVVDVKVDGGVVSVRGRLERRSETELAVRLIRAMPGVVDVEPSLSYGWDDTNLKVASGLQPRF
jgi:hypothetical protein